jgi:outer membrane biogenesis lipoprotein LolB
MNKVKLIFFLTVTTLFVGCATTNSHGTYNKTSPPCYHVWNKWSEPSKDTNWLGAKGTVQYRSCDKCGQAEKRWIY